MFESEAYQNLEDSGPYHKYLNELAISSIAISLKRIADALCLPGPDKAQLNLAEVVSSIEMNTRKN